MFRAGTLARRRWSWSCGAGTPVRRLGPCRRSCSWTCFWSPHVTQRHQTTFARQRPSATFI